MEKINTDYKRPTWKVEANLFKTRKSWRSCFKMSKNIPGKGMLRGHVEPTANRTASLSCSSCCASTFFPTSALLINVIPSSANKFTRRCTIYGKQNVQVPVRYNPKANFIHKLNIHTREINRFATASSIVICYSWRKERLSLEYHFHFYWLVYKSRATFSTNQKQNLNQSCLKSTRFPALRIDYMNFFRVMIVSVDFLCPLSLVQVTSSNQVKNALLIQQD